MFDKGSTSDKVILKKVNQRLARASLGSHSRVTTTIRNGQVTLSGSIQYESQRRPALKAASSVEGVRAVLDHLKVLPRETHHGQLTPRDFPGNAETGFPGTAEAD